MDARLKKLLVHIETEVKSISDESRPLKQEFYESGLCETLSHLWKLVEADESNLVCKEIEK